MTPISIFIIICLTITCLFTLGLIAFLTDSEENKCDMTYMFQYPQFVRVHVKADRQYPKYALYAYSEGRFTENARRMIFKGIPVLFIHGNGGSHRQARSYASVALRKSFQGGYNFHFNFFAVDLNKELNALNGALLYEQTEYIQYCIYRILELYKNNPQPVKSIVLMAHSMGGIIARGLLQSLSTDAHLIPLVITLAAPHSRSILSLDKANEDYYKSINQTVSPDTTFISIGGGFNDFLVAPFTTYSTSFDNLHVMSTAVPKCWLSMDHKCILWCKQLVMAVTRALFDCVDPVTKQLTDDGALRRSVFHHHLIHNSGIKIMEKPRYAMSLSLPTRNDEWIECELKQQTIDLPKGTRNTQWYMIPFPTDEQPQMISIVAINLEVTDWAFVCSAMSNANRGNFCLNTQHLSHLSAIAPTSRYKRRSLQLNASELRANFSDSSHILLRVTPTNEPLTIHVDVYNAAARRLTVTLPNWLMPRTLIPTTSENAIDYQLVLPQLAHVMQFYKLHVDAIHCTVKTHHATASLSVPWGHEDVHRYFTETQTRPLDVRLYHSKPPGADQSLQGSVHLRLDPNCRYAITMKHSFFGMLGQLARTYTPLLIANVAAVVLLIVRHQLSHIDATGNCSLFFIAIQTGVRPYYVVTMIGLASKVLSWRVFSNLIRIDWEEIIKEGNDFPLLPLLLYMCSVGLVWMGAIGLATSMIFCESTIHRFAAKFLSRTITGVGHFSDWLMGGMRRLPEIVAATLVIVSVSSCGSLALCLGCLFYFLKLTQMSQDFIEDLVVKTVKYAAKQVKCRFFAKEKPKMEVVVPVVAAQSETATDRNDEEEAKSARDSDIEVLDESNEEGSADNQQFTDCMRSQHDHVKPVPLEDRDSDIEVLEEDVNTGLNEENLENAPLEESNAQIPTDSNLNNDAEDEIPAHSCIFFHFSLFLIWFLITLLNLPYVLTWAHNYHYSMVLRPDPSFWPGIILSFCSLPLWRLDLPKPNRKWYKQLGFVLYLMAAIGLIYGLLSIYRLSYILTAAMLLIVLHQLFAPKKEREVEAIDDDDDKDGDNDLHAAVESVKAKWE